MVESASLTMLKNAGAKAKAVEQELEKDKPPTPETAQAGEQVSVDVDTMSAEELDALVKDNEIKTPEAWNSWDATGKREWLKAQFSEDGPEAQGDEGKPVAATPEDPIKVAADGELVGSETLAADEPKAKAKAKSKSKGSKFKAVSTAPKEGEIMEADVLQDMIHEVENLKEPEAQALIGKLLEQTEVSYFKIGGILSVIQSSGWYQPYASFREFVEKQHGIGYRVALNWIEIYNRLSNSGIPWAKVSALGWTKLAVIASVISNENVEEWVGIAKEQNTITLIDTVKAHKAKAQQKEQSSGEPVKTTTTMAFKVHEDQKSTIEAAIDKAKKLSGTQVAAVALEFACLDFLGGQSLADRMKTVGVENALKALETAFPNMNFDVSLGEEEQVPTNKAA